MSTRADLSNCARRNKRTSDRAPDQRTPRSVASGGSTTQPAMRWLVSPS